MDEQAWIRADLQEEYDPSDDADNDLCNVPPKEGEPRRCKMSDSLYLVGLDNDNPFGYRLYINSDDDLEVYETRGAVLDRFVPLDQREFKVYRIVREFVKGRVTLASPAAYTNMLTHLTGQKVSFLLDEAAREEQDG